MKISRQFIATPNVRNVPSRVCGTHEESIDYLIDSHNMRSYIPDYRRCLLMLDGPGSFVSVSFEGTALGSYQNYEPGMAPSNPLEASETIPALNDPDVETEVWYERLVAYQNQPNDGRV